MELKQLMCFVRVAELGSFTKASIALSVAQPALSKQVRRLEVELRQTLFNRNGRGIMLTEEGRVFFDHAKGIVDQVERARHALDSAKDSPLGKVVIATPYVNRKAFTAGVISEFRARFPRASLEVIQGKSRFIYEWLLSGRIDIGMLYDPPATPLLDITPLVGQELSLFSLATSAPAPNRKPVPFRELGRLPLILPSMPHTTRALVDAEASRAGISLDIAIQVDGASFILELVELGLGCAILPEFSLQHSRFPDKLQINAIVRPQLVRGLNVAVSRQRPSTHLTRQTLQLIRRHLGTAPEQAKR